MIGVPKRTTKWSLPVGSKTVLRLMVQGAIMVLSPCVGTLVKPQLVDVGSMAVDQGSTPCRSLFSGQVPPCDMSGHPQVLLPFATNIQIWTDSVLETFRLFGGQVGHWNFEPDWLSKLFRKILDRLHFCRFPWKVPHRPFPAPLRMFGVDDWHEAPGHLRPVPQEIDRFTGSVIFGCPVRVWIMSSIYTMASAIKTQRKNLGMW